MFSSGLRETEAVTGRQKRSPHFHARSPAPVIASWQWRDAAAEAAPDYDDATWTSSPQPQPFGAYNFQNGYGWYRAKFTASAAGSVTATISGGVRASALAFANGTSVKVSASGFTFNAVAGSNTIAILAKHEGLDKLYNTTGSTGTTEYAGIWGNVNNGSSALASSWKFRGGLGGMDETSVVGLVKNWTTFVGGTWSDTQTTKSWPAFWRGTFKSPLQAGVFATVGLRTTGLSSGSAWVNGHNIGRFSGNTQLYVPECWLTADNTVVIYDASGSSPTGVKLEYIETRARYAPSAGTGGGGGTGGTGGTGGITGSGGRSSSGGGAGAGGSIVTGGSTASGSASVSVGSGGSNAGGARSSGGAVSSSRTAGAGGGGVSSQAGMTGSGGRSEGGAISAGGSTQVKGGSIAEGSSGSGGASTRGATSANSNPAASSSGCSCATGGHSKGQGIWLALGLAVIGLRRKYASRHRRRE